MSRRTDRAPLLDMCEAARHATRIFNDATAHELEEDLRTHFALLHLVALVGEAANRVSALTREAHPEIPWREIIGMRHRLIHGYDQISREIVHDTVAVDLPRLIEQLRSVLDEPSSAVATRRR